MRTILAFIITIATALSLSLDSWDAFKSVKFCFRSSTQQRKSSEPKDNLQNGKKGFSDYIVDQGLMSRIDKETLKPKSKRHSTV